jgi:hypothetical protein
MARSPRVPWQRPNPRKRAGTAKKPLTSAEKPAAKARVARAARHYPDLIDNMAAAAKKGAKTKTSGRKRVAKSLKAPSASKGAARKSGIATRKHASDETRQRCVASSTARPLRPMIFT